MRAINNVVNKLAGTPDEWVDAGSFCVQGSNHMGTQFYVGALESSGEWSLVRFTGAIGQSPYKIGTYPSKGECMGAARTRTN